MDLTAGARVLTEARVSLLQSFEAGSEVQSTNFPVGSEGFPPGSVAEQSSTAEDKRSGANPPLQYVFMA